MMTIVNEVEYNRWKSKNTDSFGTIIFNFLEEWATLIEDGIHESGEDPLMYINKNARKLRSKTKYFYISGAMYEFAINILSDYWKYGKILKEWNENYSKNNIIEVGNDLF